LDDAGLDGPAGREALVVSQPLRRQSEGIFADNRRDRYFDPLVMGPFVTAAFVPMDRPPRRANSSLKANSLLARNIQGIHSIGARLPHITAENSEISQCFVSEFPTHPNREFPVALQGIESGDHGIFWPDQGRGCRDRLALAS
jgi:hypothetical protein